MVGRGGGGGVKLGCVPATHVPVRVPAARRTPPPAAQPLPRLHDPYSFQKGQSHVRDTLKYRKKGVPTSSASRGAMAALACTRAAGGQAAPGAGPGVVLWEGCQVGAGRGKRAPADFPLARPSRPSSQPGDDAH